MRLPIRSSAVVSLFLALVGCSAGNATPAPRARASKPASSKPVRMAEASLAPSPEVVEALARATRARGQPAAPEPKPSAPVKAPVARPLPHAITAHGSLDTAKLGSRGLLRWLPPDAALVVRLPHVEELGEVRRRTTMGALLQNPAVMLSLCAPGGPLGQLRAKIHAELPELEALLEKLPELKGELVLGLTHLEPPADSKPGAAGKVTAALAFDAGAGADELQPLLEPLLARLQQACAADCARPEAGWGLAGWSGDSCFEIRRFGNVFTALCGNDPEFAHAFQPEGESASFASATVVASAPDLNSERPGVLEFYLNADPAWSLVKGQAPAEAQAVIEKLGLYGVHGAAMSLGLDAKGMAEVHTWSAPAHQDVLSRVLAGAPAKRELARWIPADAAAAGLYEFDLRALYETIVGLLPEAQQAELQQTLAQGRKQTRIDLAADVIENFGPSFAMVSRGDALGLSGGPAGLCLAIETHDDDKVGELIGKLAPLLPPALKRRTSEFGGHALLTYDLSTLGMAVSSISLCRVDGALLVATDEQLLERCLLGGQGAGHQAGRAGGGAGHGGRDRREPERARGRPAGDALGPARRRSGPLALVEGRRGLDRLRLRGHAAGRVGDRDPEAAVGAPARERDCGDREPAQPRQRRSAAAELRRGRRRPRRCRRVRHAGRAERREPGCAGITRRSMCRSCPGPTCTTGS